MVTFASACGNKDGANKEYTVTFDTDGGSVIEAQKVLKGGYVVKPNDPEKAGYSFEGWSAPVIGDWVFDKLAVNSDMTLKAKWKIIDYTITYDLDGGENSSLNPTTYNVESEKITLEAPTKNGYKFLGWKDGENIVTEIATGSTGNRTLTASWSQKYYITYELGEGVNSVNNPHYYYAEDADITFEAPTHETDKFIEWQIDGVKVNGIPTGSTGDKTVTAVWSTRYYISYELGRDGVNNPNNPSYYYAEDTDISFEAPTHETNKFIEWQIGGVKVNGIPTGSTGNKTITAVWSTRYYITYELDGGTNGANNPSHYFKEDETIVLEDAAKPGYDFVEWRLGGDMVTEIPTGSIGDKTLTAVFEAKKFKIYFDNTDGSTVTPSYVEVTYGQLIPTLPIPEKEDKEFVHWLDGDDNRIISGETYKAVTDTTVYAEWKDVQHLLVTLNADGGTVSTSSIYVVQGRKIGTLPLPSKDGWRFVAWTLDGGNVNTDTIWEKEEGGELVATYVRLYNVTLSLDGGTLTGGTAFKLAKGDKLGELPQPKKDGYRFTGWTLNGSVVNSETVWETEADGELVATYVYLCTITLDPLEGSLLGSKEVYLIKGDKIGELPQAKKDGFRFMGWMLDGVMVNSDTVWDTEGDGTLVAHYVRVYKIRFTTVAFVRKAEVESILTSSGSVGLGQGQRIEAVEIEVLDGQSLKDAHITALPTVKPADEDEYTFKNAWRLYKDKNDTSPIEITLDTVFNEVNFPGVEGVIVLRPYLRSNWTPIY